MGYYSLKLAVTVTATARVGSINMVWKEDEECGDAVPVENIVWAVLHNSSPPFTLYENENVSMTETACHVLYILCAIKQSVYEMPSGLHPSDV